MKLFYSYSHQDKSFRDDMEKHLAVLKEKHLINEWHDEKILPGSKWNDEIEAQMKSADIILLLLSPDFLASPSCKEETNRAFDLSTQKGIPVIPVVLISCSWKTHQKILERQVLPLGGEPIECWSDRNAAFVSVCEGIEKVIENIGSSIEHKSETKLFQNNCPICGADAYTRLPSPDARELFVDCAGVCAEYSISTTAEVVMEDCGHQVKKNLKSWLNEQRRNGERRPAISTVQIERARNASSRSYS